MLREKMERRRQHVAGHIGLSDIKPMKRGYKIEKMTDEQFREHMSNRGIDLRLNPHEFKAYTSCGEYRSDGQDQSNSVVEVEPINDLDGCCAVHDTSTALRQGDPVKERMGLAAEDFNRCYKGSKPKSVTERALGPVVSLAVNQAKNFL